MSYIHFVLLVSALAVVKIADALQCYKCESYDKEVCADYFNVTEINRSNFLYNRHDGSMPEKTTCENQFLPYPANNQRAVCMKKVETEYGRQRYTRQCVFLNRDLNTIECPREPQNNHRTLDFCEVCDTDFCNSAPSLLNTLPMLLLPLFVVVLLRN